MNLSQGYEFVWFGLNQVLSEAQTPEPEICIKPVCWQRRLELAEACTTVKAVVHPVAGESGAPQFLFPKVFNDRAYQRLLVYEALDGLKHLERADGVPLQAGNADDYDFLFARLGPHFFAWVSDRVLEVNEQADTAIKLRQRDARKNF